jgi:hypothetical protein
LARSYLGKTHHKKRAGVVAGVGPVFKPQYHKKKEERRKEGRKEGTLGFGGRLSSCLPVRFHTSIFLTLMWAVVSKLPQLTPAGGPQDSVL